MSEREAMMTLLDDVAREVHCGRVIGVCVLTVTAKGWTMRQAGNNPPVLVEDLGKAADHE
jgi:hypothetical protein